MGLQPSTQFQIASISKTFTAATVLALVDDARLSLDDRLADWMNDAPEIWSKITLHHLLTHTSGLPHWDGVPALDLHNGSVAQISLHRSHPRRFDPSPAQIGRTAASASSCSRTSPSSPPSAHGLRWSRNECYGRPTSVTPRLPSQPTPQLPPTAARTAARPAPSNSPQSISGTGDIWSTTGDLARWPRVLTATDLLSPSAQQQMLAPQARIMDEEGGLRDVSYGYGWFIARYGDAPDLPPGDQAGFTSFLLWAPEAELTVAVLSADELELGPLSSCPRSSSFSIPRADHPGVTLTRSPRSAAARVALASVRLGGSVRQGPLPVWTASCKTPSQSPLDSHRSLIPRHWRSQLLVARPPSILAVEHGGIRDANDSAFR